MSSAISLKYFHLFNITQPFSHNLIVYPVFSRVSVDVKMALKVPIVVVALV